MKVHVNCAASIDGKIATRERRQIRISSEEDMARVHRLRNSHDAVLVGVGTVIADDPKLTVKEGYVDVPKQPATVVVDPRGRCPPGALALNAERSYLAVSSGVEPVMVGDTVVIECGSPLDLNVLLETLEDEGIRSVLVEGGGETIWGFFRAGLVNTMSVYIGSLVIGGREAPTIADGEGFLRDAVVAGRLISVENLGGGVVLSYEF